MSIDRAVELYEMIAERHRKDLVGDFGNLLRSRFDARFPDTGITATKKLDFVLWKLGAPEGGAARLPARNSLRTVKHDGHLFVVYGKNGGICHHPACPCLKGRP